MPNPTPPLAPTPYLRHPRGSAMVETVLALPVILIFAVLLIGFGVGLKRLSPLQNTARYDSWHRTTPGAPGPSSDADLTGAFYPKDAPASLDRAADGSLPSSVDQPLKDALTDADANNLATKLLERFPRGMGVAATVRHDSSLPLLSQIGFTSSVKRSAYRLNGDWRFSDGIGYVGQPWAAYADGWHPNDGGARLAPSIQELFLQSLDQSLPADGGALSSAIRAIYTRYPGYHGPNGILNPAWFIQP